jgi:cobalt-zinc-cadmium efflux system outer membrane protein
MTEKTLLAIAVIALAGCATISSDRGFEDVRATLAGRGVKRVQWNRGGPEDRESAEAVEMLLREPLSPDSAVQIALLNNRRLQATYEELGIAQATLVQAGLLKNPVFSAALLFPEANGRIDLHFEIAQDFLSVLYRPLRQQSATAEFEAAKLRVSGAVLDLAAQVRAEVYRAQAAQQTIELLRQVVDATQAAQLAAKRLYEAGNITELELLNRQGLYESARLALAEAESELMQERERLNALMGLWGAQTQWKMDARLPPIPDEPFDPAGIEAKAIAESLDLAASRKQMESAAARLGASQARLQTLELGAEAEREEGEWKGGPKLAAPLPLFDYGQVRRAAAESELRRLQEEHAAIAVEIRAAARHARDALALARARALHVQRMLLPLKTRIVEQTQLQYNAMQVGIFQLLLAQQEQIAAAREYVNRLRDYWLARTELELLLAGRFAHSAGTRAAGTPPAPGQPRGGRS